VTSQTNDRATIELKLTTTGVVWLADLEAQGTEHLRVRLRADDLGVLPVLAAGTSLECTMRSPDGDYYVTGTILQQVNATLWLSLPPMWRKAERRDFARQSGGFAVKYFSDKANGVAACVDISAGGIKIRVKQPLPERSKLELFFTLPGEGLPVEVQGLILHCNATDTTDGGFDLGIKFTNLQLGDAARIARYCGG
jgi:hypothetical protein